MRRIVIASHGNLAEGMRSTLSILTGGQDQIVFMCGYVDDSDMEEQVKQFFAETEEDAEVIVFTDLLGGSVNAIFLPYLSRPRMHLLAGFNLGLVLELLAVTEEELTECVILTVVERARKGIVYVNSRDICYDEQDDV